MSLKIGEPVLVNGVEWTHHDIKFLFQGIPIIGISQISYSSPQDINQNYGTGSKPVSFGYGAKKPTANITMSMTEYQRLAQSAPEGEIQNYDLFDIIIAFAGENGFFTHRLLSCKMKGPAIDSTVDNSQIEVKIELAVGDIKYA